MKENDLILLALCWNGASSVADGKPCQVYMLLSQNGYGMLTRTTLLAFELSINVPWTLTMHIVGYLHYIHKAPSAWLIVHVWLYNTHLLGQVEAYSLIPLIGIINNNDC